MCATSVSTSPRIDSASRHGRRSTRRRVLRTEIEDVDGPPEGPGVRRRDVFGRSPMSAAGISEKILRTDLGRSSVGDTGDRVGQETGEEEPQSSSLFWESSWDSPWRTEPGDDSCGCTRLSFLNPELLREQRVRCRPGPRRDVSMGVGSGPAAGSSSSLRGARRILPRILPTGPSVFRRSGEQRQAAARTLVIVGAPGTRRRDGSLVPD